MDDLYIKDGKLVFKISRRKSNDPYQEDPYPDKYDMDIEYDLVVEYVNGKYKATKHFPTIEMPKVKELSKSLSVANQPNLENEQPIASTKQQSFGLGKLEHKHISCAYKGRETDCPQKCKKCAIKMKNNGDVALAKEQLDESIKLYKKAVFIEPKFAEAWVNLGNAYGMKGEYNNALLAFDKALGVDFAYGEALLGQAIMLRNLGSIGKAAELADLILATYPDADGVQKFRETLGSVVSVNKAMNRIKQRTYIILEENGLLSPKDEVISEEAILCQADYSACVLRFCYKHYATSILNKIYSESMLTAFYGSLCTTLFYYNDKKGFNGIHPFEYLSNHINIEDTEITAEQLLGIRNDKKACIELWNMIYDYVTFACETIELVSAEEIDIAIQSATEHAYIMGMAYAIAWNKKHNSNNHF